MVIVAKTKNLLNLINSIDFVLKVGNETIDLKNHPFSLNKAKEELYFLSSHRYIDNRTYLFNLGNKFTHYLQLLHIKPKFQQKLKETINLSMNDLTQINSIIKTLQNPFIPDFYKKMVCYTMTSSMKQLSRKVKK
jgi:hypothetical protein